MFYFICKILISPILWLWYPTRFVGKKNLKIKGKMIISANHQSNRDGFVLASHMWRKIYFMGKKELFENKVLGAVLKAWGGYPVNRGEPDITAIKTTLRLLKEGKAMAIFPEGTRIKNTEMKALKNGVAMFASRTESPIVPAFFIKKPRPFVCNTFLIGKPFYLHQIFGSTSLTKEQLSAASEYISERILELLRLYEEEKIQKKIMRKMKKVKVK